MSLLDESKISVGIRVSITELRLIITALEITLDLPMETQLYADLLDRIKAMKIQFLEDSLTLEEIDDMVKQVEALDKMEMETIIISDKIDVNIKSTQENESPGEV